MGGQSWKEQGYMSKDNPLDILVSTPMTQPGPVDPHPLVHRLLEHHHPPPLYVLGSS